VVFDEGFVARIEVSHGAEITAIVQVGPDTPMFDV
jgi:hypothetical protein